MSRLKTLGKSLESKTIKLDKMIQEHFEDVRSANGQPLNDKRNGAATFRRWERKNAALGKLKTEIEKTRQAIEKEQYKQFVVLEARDNLPIYVLKMIDAKELTLWRTHPNTFFVPGVEKARITYNPKTGDFGHRYLSDIAPEQYPAFRDTFNKLAALRRLSAKESA